MNMEATQTQTNTPEQHSVLMDSIAKYMLGMIHSIVDARVNQIFEAHATVKQLDEQWEERIKGFVAEAMDEHNADNDHPSNDDISDTVATHIAHIDFTDNIERAVEQILRDNDYVTEDRAIELAGDACADIDFEEKVREALQEIITK